MSILVANGRLTAGARSAGFGELTHGEKLEKTIPASVALGPRGEWKVAGVSAAKVNGPAIVTGAHRYSFDMRRPGMLYGKVLRPESFGAQLVSLDSTAAGAMPRVKVVRDGNFVGVTAPDPQSAEKALAALKAEWRALAGQTKQPGCFRILPRESAAGLRPAEAAFQTYTVAYIAHVPLEPRAAVAEWSADGSLTVWTGTQRPFGVRSELATKFGLAEEKVRESCRIPDRATAASMRATRPWKRRCWRRRRGAVKRNWTREEEMTWAYFRPGGLIEVTGKARPTAR